jgi:hypothetical protein
MKLSEKTLSVLKNFSTINQSIFIKCGDKLRTISLMKNILAEASVPEDFPKDFAIYDLSQFLVGLTLHDNPVLDFTNDSFVYIKDGSTSRVKYFFSDPAVIVQPPDNELTLPSTEVSFKVDSSDLSKLLKASSVYQLPDLSVVGESNSIYLKVRDKKNDTSNEYSINVGSTESEFSFNFKVENIRIIPGSYNVEICKQGLSKFTNTDIDLKYYIALEPDSDYAS